MFMYTLYKQQHQLFLPLLLLGSIFLPLLLLLSLLYKLMYFRCLWIHNITHYTCSTCSSLTLLEWFKYKHTRDKPNSPEKGSNFRSWELNTSIYVLFCLQFKQTEFEFVLLCLSHSSQCLPLLPALNALIDLLSIDKFYKKMYPFQFLFFLFLLHWYNIF